MSPSTIDAFYEPEIAIFLQSRDSVVKRDGKSILDMVAGRKEYVGFLIENLTCRDFTATQQYLERKMNFTISTTHRRTEVLMRFCTKQTYKNNCNLFFPFDLFLEMPNSRPISRTQTTLHLPKHNFIQAHSIFILGKIRVLLPLYQSSNRYGMEDWAVARPQYQLQLGDDTTNSTFDDSRRRHTLEMSSNDKMSSRLDFSASEMRAGVILWREKGWGETIFCKNENLISRYGVFNQRRNRGIKAERILRLSMRKTTCERLEEVLGRAVDGIRKKG